MLIIDCPHCGPRHEQEFHYGKQAHVAYPQDPSALTDAEWARYLFYRDNPRGPHAERWVHTAGCRRWFNVVRDTLTYEIKAVYRAGEQPPQEYAALARPRGGVPAATTDQAVDPGTADTTKEA
ncbi:sarcosine oxidase subunit delta [Ornithinimicrobium flavum]|uniref:sarcosine oxidase subunit delta n=1 Tax=Ornithinimicrobium flavum TaxID=1288636 RepID=UPI00106F1E80|nr:sarcosine oxidase subunit delta [Ornithinimicrobium flavum]